MSETKFTQGEWFVVRYKPIDKFIAVSPAGIKVDNDDVDPDESRANACLVAAAPDLYAALASIYEDVVQGAIPNNGDVWYENTRRVLAKARGEQP